MASVIEDGRDSLLEAQRTSLLDIIEDRNRTLNKKRLLDRVVIISRMTHQNLNDIGQWFEKYIRDVQNRKQSEGVSGLLLLYPKHCVHVIETCSDITLELMKQLKEDEESGSGNTSVSKILVISHDIPHRQYNQWSYRVVDIEAPKIEEYETTEEVQSLVCDIIMQLLKLGGFISRQPKNSTESLHDKVPELLPPQDIVDYLLVKEEDCVMTPKEFVHMYEQPYDVPLAIDYVWPLPARTLPYNN
ncbi:hypothetical protein CAPTEDRAFT_219432 [Capitella teleta]|uniref:BLUF domain-containing protein n=1 Tax=Capitella teleta TaxID=283909 RepID=R7V9Z1_CAPTE|nr:hypothetical protein CAPTEDRAFT_219432 [Capitella teleta]|eukprot:ELU15643.1 hypothetical protein CAPTEDRAFT_219432 [Capitella teleta]